MLRIRLRKSVKGLALVLFPAVLWGCGAPDLNTMKPTAWKPAATVFLVDHPDNWTAADVQKLAMSHQVVVDVKTCSSTQLLTELQGELKQPDTGLFLIVQNTPVSGDELGLAQSNVNRRFEFVTTQVSSMSPLNVRQVVNDVSASAYSLGWLAGQACAATGAQVLGWIGGGSTSTAKAALAGLYAANQTVRPVAVTPQSQTPGSTAQGPAANQGQPGISGQATNQGQAVNQGQPGNQVQATNQVPQAPGLPVANVPLPGIVVTTRPLTVNEAAALRSSNSILFSLCWQPVGVLTAASPNLVQSTAVEQDFQALADKDWQAGTTTVKSVPFVSLNLPSAFSTVTQTELGTIQSGLQAGSISVRQAWTGVPAPVQATWTNSLGLKG